MSWMQTSSYTSIQSGSSAFVWCPFRMGWCGYGVDASRCSLKEKSNTCLFFWFMLCVSFFHCSVFLHLFFFHTNDTHNMNQKKRQVLLYTYSLEKFSHDTLISLLQMDLCVCTHLNHYRRSQYDNDIAWDLAVRAPRLLNIT